MCSHGDDVCGVWDVWGIRMGFVMFVHPSLEGLTELVAFWKCPDPHW